MHADMLRRTKQLKVDLEPIMNDAQNSIQEEDFLKFFLPLFAGELTKRSEYDVAIAA